MLSNNKCVRFACKCSCHLEVTAILFDTPCTQEVCQCGQNVSSANVLNLQSFPEVADFKCSFRPISGDVDNPTEHVNGSSSNQSLLPDCFHTPNDFTRSSSVSAMKTPSDFMLSSNDGSNFISNISDKENELESAISSTLQKLLLLDDSECNNSDKLPPFQSSASSSGFFTPDDFLRSSSSSCDLTTLSSAPLINDEAFKIVSTKLNDLEDNNNPLNDFCTKLGVNSDTSVFMPPVPGGENLKRRLFNQDGSEDNKLPLSNVRRPKRKLLVAREDLEHQTSNNECPRIAVFWDIENCQVPRGENAGQMAHAVREMFYGDHKEYEFYVVMDATNPRNSIASDLLKAEVTVIHVSHGEKNAADAKLLYLMGRYLNYHKTGHTCILISGDSNFSTILHEMKHRNHMNVILLHNHVTNDQLKKVSHFAFLYTVLCDHIPTPECHTVSLPRELRGSVMIEYCEEAKYLAIHGLPNQDYKILRNKLHIMVENMGGKVFQVYPPHAFVDMRDANTAIRKLYDPSLSDRTKELIRERDSLRAADRTSGRIPELNEAKSRLDGEYVYERRICTTITNTLSLANFQLAQSVNEVHHYCLVDDDVRTQDERCKRFREPHAPYKEYSSANKSALPSYVQHYGNLESTSLKPYSYTAIAGTGHHKGGRRQDLTNRTPAGSAFTSAQETSAFNIPKRGSFSNHYQGNGDGYQQSSTSTDEFQPFDLIGGNGIDSSDTAYEDEQTPIFIATCVNKSLGNFARPQPPNSGRRRPFDEFRGFSAGAAPAVGSNSDSNDSEPPSEGSSFQSKFLRYHGKGGHAAS